jgi:hypothetical protein
MPIKSDSWRANHFAVSRPDYHVSIRSRGDFSGDWTCKLLRIRRRSVARYDAFRSHRRISLRHPFRHPEALATLVARESSFDGQATASTLTVAVLPKGAPSTESPIFLDSQKYAGVRRFSHGLGPCAAGNADLICRNLNEGSR